MLELVSYISLQNLENVSYKNSKHGVLACVALLESIQFYFILLTIESFHNLYRLVCIIEIEIPQFLRCSLFNGHLPRGWRHFLNWTQSKIAVKYLSILSTEIGKSLYNKPHCIAFRAISLNTAGSATFLQQIAVMPDGSIST